MLVTSSLQMTLLTNQKTLLYLVLQMDSAPDVPSMPWDAKLFAWAHTIIVLRKRFSMFYRQSQVVLTSSCGLTRSFSCQQGRTAAPGVSAWGIYFRDISVGRAGLPSFPSRPSCRKKFVELDSANRGYTKQLLSRSTSNIGHQYIHSSMALSEVHFPQRNLSTHLRPIKTLRRLHFRKCQRPRCSIGSSHPFALWGRHPNS